MKITGDAIHIERGRRGLTQRQMADKLGVSLRTVVAWEKGESDIPRTRYAAIRAALGDDELATASANGLDLYTEIDLLTELIRRSATRLAQHEQSQSANEGVRSVTTPDVGPIFSSGTPGGEPVSEDGVGSLATRGTRQDQQAEREADQAARIPTVKRSAQGRRRRTGS